MTLAAAYLIGRVPALLSDVLVSGGSREEHHPIATRVDLNEPLPLEWEVRVNGLTRKATKLGKNAAVAGAGNGLALSAICRKLDKLFRDQIIRAEVLAKQLSDMDDALSPATACTLIGWVVEEGGSHSFQWESTAPEQISWDDDYVTGTGADLFREIAWSEAQRTWEAIGDFDYAQHYALTQISSLLVNEIVNGAPIQNLFGGGYDLLLWDGTRFRQAADVTFLFFSLEWLRSAVKRLDDAAPILIRQAELEDCLVVRAIVPANQLSVTSDKGERMAIIAPLSLLGRKHTFHRPHDPSEIPHFADRIFVNITGVGRSGSLEHWSSGVRGAEATLFHLEADQARGTVRLYFPIAVMEKMRIAAEKHLGFDRLPPVP